MSQLKVPGLAQRLVPMKERGAKTHARIRGDRRHPDALKIGFAQDAGVGDAIQRNAARDDQVLGFLHPLHFTYDVQQRFFRPVLQGPGDIVVVLGQRLADFPAPSKQGVETRLEGLDQAVGRILDVVLVDRYAPARKQADQIFEFFFVGRPAERRQRHHRTFLEKRKAEMFRDAGVDHAQAVEHRVRPLLLDSVALASPRTGGAVVAIAVRDQDGGFFER